MKLLGYILTIFSINAFSYTELRNWTACEGTKCKEVKAGDDLYLKHHFKSEEASYKTTFDKNQIRTCLEQNDCWLYLGSVGDSLTVKLNDEVIGNFPNYVHFESLKFQVPRALIKDKNQIAISVKDLNQTRFGLRSPEVGIGLYSEVSKLSNVDWLLRTGSPLLSAFTLFVLLLGLVATYTVYRNSKILPIIGLSFVGGLYLLSFSEIPRQFLDPVYASGPIHFVLRLSLDLSIILVSLSLYRPHKKISFLSKLPYFYIFPITLMLGTGLFGIHHYEFYKITMLIVAPLVTGGGLSLAVLSYYYYEQKERQIVFPLFIGLWIFQVYDLIVFWELINGSFTVKWYLPFLVISFAWIYVRRRIFEVRTLKIDALVGDEVRKLAHDLAAPIKNLTSLAGTNEPDLISRNLKDLENLTHQVLGKYNLSSNEDHLESQESLHFILSDIEKKFQDRITITFDFSMEFVWYNVNATLFTRVFTNLITNSIKANAKKMEIHGYYLNNFLTIDVCDNGEGIPKKIQPYIFDKGITSDKIDGNGLGLSFIKEKLEELGFNIKLQKSSPMYTLFQIQIPMKEIVLIDDNLLVRDTWTALAKKVGIQIKAYPRSKDIEFKQIAKSTPVFIDHDLGEENGLSVAQQLIQLGFKNVALATGERTQLHPQIRQITKEFPI